MLLLLIVIIKNELLHPNFDWYCMFAFRRMHYVHSQLYNWSRMCRVPIWSQYITMHTLVVHRNVRYTVYNFHFFTQQVLLSKVPYSGFLRNQNFDLGVISILLWQLSYVCAMMWWLKCIPRSSLKALKKYISGYNISEYEVIQTLSVIVVKGLLNQPPLCLFF